MAHFVEVVITETVDGCVAMVVERVVSTADKYMHSPVTCMRRDE